MLSGPSRRLPPPSAEGGPVPVPAPTSAPLPTPLSRQTLALPAVSAPPIARTAPSRRTPPAGARARASLRHRRRWPRLALWTLIPPALLFVVLVPPQSLRATLVTLLIVAALGLVVWRLPMGDDE